MAAVTRDLQRENRTMGRKSREKRERREGQAGSQQAAGAEAMTDQQRLDRIGEIERELNWLADGDYASGGNTEDVPLEDRQNYLEDVLAFESVGSGPSLFEGLEANGLKLPPPERLSDRECFGKTKKIMKALLEIGVILMGFEHMSPRELYSTLFHQTLWEGCYAKRRFPGLITFMDVSHRMQRSEMVDIMKNIQRAQRVQ
jgi:hypothetical protein